MIPPQPPNYQSGPNYPPAPNYQSGANYQSSAGYQLPSYQSGANYQSGPGYPPPNYQSGANYQSGPGYPPPNNQWQPSTNSQAKPRAAKKQAAPLPLWLFISGIILTIALLVALYILGSDWAEGASQASVAALIIAVLVAVGWFVRTHLRQITPSSKPRRLISTAFLLLLLIFSGWGRASQATLHIWQGQSFENQQKWQPAINEYTFAGETAPLSTDLARTYTSWGQDLNKHQQYNDALAKFNYIITQFDTTGTQISADQGVAQQIKLAKQGSVDARIAMAQQNIQAHNYNAATSSLDTTLGLQYCDDSCRQRAQPLDATAYYQLGSDQLQAKNYSSAVDNFNKILTSFPDAKEANDTRTSMSKALLGLGESQLHNKDYQSAEDSFSKILSTYPYPAKAKQIHSDLAQTIMGLAATARAGSCTDSLKYYQQLAKDYKDTPQGQQAQQQLNIQPDVKGHFVNTTPEHNFYQIALVQGLHGLMTQDEIFSKWDNAPYKTSIQPNGDFVFQGIPEGSYDLMWYSNDGVTEHVEFIYKELSFDPEYVANIGPLCTVNMGTVTNVTGANS
ncbi:hypothetical protein KDH_06490 [Dictyobacter sp. S3.2.2.5]|uniref:Outer membrane lipoprotein BamD-like domain-containing protein n=2 Tax=Dictyobacter halimunensis TaxID=3026934 RepID=A0ABQ6FJH3_9CHLR|nr:hypothetical protein KDH_06490 [Dictyobacter sp. S3.2.2.5]